MTNEITRASRFKPKFVPTFTLTTAYAGALKRGFDDLDTGKVLRALSREVLKRIRAEISQTAFSVRAKKRLATALTTEMGPSSLRVVVRDPLWGDLVNGQRKGQMAWLKRARAPIPIVTESGKVIFRSATAKSLANGKWVHPGRAPLNFLARVKKEARAVVRERLGKEVMRQLRQVVR